MNLQYLSRLLKEEYTPNAKNSNPGYASNTFTLTKDQETAFNRVKNFLVDVENPAIVIMGSAGTGKTTLTKFIADYIMDNTAMAIIAVAPTHKARRVLSKKLNIGRFMCIPTITVASLLGKMREHTYIGSHKYSSGSTEKMSDYNCFILDEVSMVADSDLNEIIDYVCLADKKLILIGDNCQIPAPSQKVVRKEGENFCYKLDSEAFDIENICVLNEIVRQTHDSPIIKLATFIRDNLYVDQDMKDIIHGSQVGNLCITHDELYHKFCDDMNSGLDTRVIAYTNASVRTHNENIRHQLGFDKTIRVGELLTGYANVGYPTPIIENGTDYRVTSIRKTNMHRISSFSGLVGHIIDLVDIDDSNHISRGLFFIDIQHSANTEFMKRLLTLANMVNKRHSTKMDYKNYCNLKNTAVFLDDVYYYFGKIMTECNLKKAHPLLFTKVNDVINTKTKGIVQSELTRKLEDQYGEIIEGRLVDNKPFGDSESFADQYMIIEKDIYYGYSITAHKSQGSTYDSVYVDENDFHKITDKWNYKLGAVEHRHKERNQLKYVAYTRASKKLGIVV